MDQQPGSGALTTLGDPTRVRIVELIRAAPDGRAQVGRLAHELGLRQPTVSHHMATLLADDVVTREKDGRRTWYAVHSAVADRVAALLGEPETAAGEADFSRIVDALTTRFRGTFSRETIAHYVATSRALLEDANTGRLLASRTASFAAARLDDIARSRGDARAAPTVLFVCVQNAGRSQLAAGILRQLAGDRVVVRTAGSAPGNEVRAAVVAALDEIGVSVGGEFPKPLTDDAVRAADYVITMGCGDACPVYLGRTYLDWDLEDPGGKPLETVRRIRDDIAGRVRDLLDELSLT